MNDQTLNDDLEAELVNTQKVQQSMSIGAFSVTPMDYDPVAEEQKQREENYRNKLKHWHAQALEFGLDEETLSKVDATATPDNITSLQEYADAADILVEQKQETPELSADELYAMRRKAETDIKSLEKLPNLTQELNRRIYAEYNTSAVKAEDILHAVEQPDFDTSKLQLSIYKTKPYSVILNIKADWMQDIVEKVLQSWENNQSAEEYVERYIAKKHNDSLEGVDIEAEKKALIESLSESYQTESSPDLYKAYKAVEFSLLGKAPESELTYELAVVPQRIAKNSEASKNYAADVTTAMDAGQPFIASNGLAVIDASEQIAGNDNAMIATLVRHFIDAQNTPEEDTGKIDAVIRKSISPELYEQYLSAKAQYDQSANERREAKRMAKEDKLAQRATLEEQKHQLEMERLNRQIELESRKAELQAATAQNKSKPDATDAATVDKGSSGSDPLQQISDTVSQGLQELPKLAVTLLVDIILALLSYICLNGVTMVLGMIGIIISLIGVYKGYLKEDSAPLVLIGGYVVTAFAFILTIMR